MRTFIITVLLLLAAPLGVALTACSASTALCHWTGASGDFDDATKWTCTGGATKPDDGVYSAIDIAVTVTIDAGKTYGTNGNGICTVRTGQASTLCFRSSSGAAGTCSAPDALTTIYFGSTGSDPIGGGATTNPGSNATAHGFYDSRATTFNLNGNFWVHILSGDGSSPVYFSHVFTAVDTAETTIGTTGTNGTSSHTGNTLAFTAKGMWLDGHWGMTGNSDIFSGIYIDNGSNHVTTMDIENIEMDNGNSGTGAVRVQAISAATGACQFTFKNSFFKGTVAPNSLYFNGIAPNGTICIDGLVEDGATSAANNFMILFPTGEIGASITRTAMHGTGHRGVLNDSTAMQNASYSYLLCENDEPGSQSTVSCVTLGSSASDTTSTLDHVYLRGGLSGLKISGNDAGTPTITNSFFTTWKEEASGQGAIIQSHEKAVYNHDVVTFENLSAAIATILQLSYSAAGSNASAMGADHMTYYTPFTSVIGQALSSLNVGDNTLQIGAGTNSWFHSSISEGGGNTLGNQCGVYNSPADSNVWAGSGANSFNNGTAVVGAHHLVIPSNSLSSYTHTGTGSCVKATATTIGNWDDHTHFHPDTSYGDKTLFSFFLDPGRRAGSTISGETSFDTVQGNCGTFGGSCGTDANLFGNLALHWCGSSCSNFSKPNWDSRYTIDGNGGIVNWVLAGYQPQNLGLVNSDLAGTAPAGAEPVIAVSLQGPI